MTDLTVIAHTVIDFDIDPIAHLVAQDGLAQGRIDADAALHGVATDGGHQLVGLFLVIIFYIYSDSIKQTSFPCSPEPLFLSCFSPVNSSPDRHSCLLMSPYVPLLSFVQEQKPLGEGNTIYSTIQAQVPLWFLESIPCLPMGVS